MHGYQSSGVASGEGHPVDLILVRLLFVIVVSVACYFIEPFRLARPQDALVGAAVGVGIVLFEWKLRSVSLKRLIGAAIGSILGICGAYLFALVIRSSVPAGNTQSFLQILVMLLMAYVGLIVGASKGDLLNLAALGGIFGGEKQGKKSYKILDTSVIIDGRIADIVRWWSRISLRPRRRQSMGFCAARTCCTRCGGSSTRFSTSCATA